MNSEKPLTIGVAGPGTVGKAVIEALTVNRESLSRQCARPISLKAIAYRSSLPKPNLDNVSYYSNLIDLANDDKIDLVIETIGGTGAAKELILSSLKNQKHVISANKALIAEYGSIVISTAEEHKKCIRFEAAVGGGIPIIRTISNGFMGNKNYLDKSSNQWNRKFHPDYDGRRRSWYGRSPKDSSKKRFCGS